MQNGFSLSGKLFEQLLLKNPRTEKPSTSWPLAEWLQSRTKFLKSGRAFRLLVRRTFDLPPAVDW
jgi:hypothetical protein